ncbi:MAG: hypothetical protein PHS17_06080, partial [Desulfobacterales bacterium]|nr:hypothetical protein [Desulfobacterales bacterium]
MIQKKFRFVFGLVLAALFAISIGGCATGKSAEQSEPEKAPAPAPAAVMTPLSRGYSDIFVFEMDASQALKNDYAEPIKETQSVLVTSLLMKNKYKKVEPARSGETYKGRNGLLVKLKLNDMRITSAAARFWGGAFAGNSFMNIHMTLVVAATQSTVRAEDFNSFNNAWAASWNLG